MRRLLLVAACVLAGGCGDARDFERDPGGTLAGYVLLGAAWLAVQVVENAVDEALDPGARERRPEPRRPVRVDPDRIVHPDDIRRARARLDRLHPGMSEPEALRCLRLEGRPLAIAERRQDGVRHRVYLLDDDRWIGARYDHDGRLVEAGIEGFGWNRSW